MFLMIAALAMSIAASAQSTRVIKGAVIDKNGNPLPGATVTATGGSEVTTADADGTFSMEVPVWLKTATAQYAGMVNKKLKVSTGDMIFRMKPKVNQWFVLGDYAHYFGENGCDGNMGGLMVGCLAKWGWYGKFHAGKTDKMMCGYYQGYIENNSKVMFNATVGVTKRIIKPLHAYFGFGAGLMPEYNSFMWWDGSSSYYCWGSIHTKFALVPEIGLIGKIANHFLIHAGYQPMVNLDAGVGHTINVGLGYAF